MTQPLPPHPDLRNLKNRAKSLLKGHRHRDDRVCTVLRSLSRFEKSSAEEIFNAELSLTDVQYALAIDYGFTSWNKLKEHIEALAGKELALRVRQLVEKAKSVYLAKGPARDSISSEWDQKQRAMTWEIVGAGEAGYLADLDLAKSNRQKLRHEAAVHFGIRGDDRSKAQLLALMNDREPVRGSALGWYAAAIHPDTSDGWHAMSMRASSVPNAIEPMLRMTADRSPKVRMTALRALSAYTHLSEKAKDAINVALSDTEHKVQHAAARVLGVACPVCGLTPRPFDTEKSEPAERQQALYARRLEALVPGDDGLQKDLERSHSKKAKDRESAALNLGLRDDPRCDSHIARLLADEQAMVRRQAMRSYALRIHPMRTRDEPYCIGVAAHSVPDGIEHLFPLLSDSNAKNRRVAVEILADYAGLGDARIDGALRNCEN